MMCRGVSRGSCGIALMRVPYIEVYKTVYSADSAYSCLPEGVLSVIVGLTYIVSEPYIFAVGVPGGFEEVSASVKHTPLACPLNDLLEYPI